MQTSRIDKLNKKQLSFLEKHLLNDFQHDFPLVSRPYKELADKLETTEDIVIETLKELNDSGYVSRIGAVFRANSIGSSTLAAMSIPEREIECVAQLINEYSEVNHNYKREHHFNLWFVLTATDEHELNAVMDDIELKTGYKILYLPMVEDFHIDLGFDIDFETRRAY